MAVNPLSALVSRAAGTRAQLSSSYSICRNCWVTMAVNPLSASVSRAAGTRAQLSCSCSTCDLLLFYLHQDRNIL